MSSLLANRRVDDPTIAVAGIGNNDQVCNGR
jgi:hypothetical protein